MKHPQTVTVYPEKNENKAVALPARGPAYGGRAHSAHGHLEC